jgi:hypothetical protein
MANVLTRTIQVLNTDSAAAAAALQDAVTTGTAHICCSK